ncbi:MAG TPA: amino acid adenylation domain-containing protein, partial [Solirubrobacterales bacterium]|nr:amino acid adenylation domain-containing protein [Solirubrobacterales bacterium]
LDPRHPRERLRFMLADSGARLLLTQRHLIPSLPEHACEVFLLDEQRGELCSYSAEDVGVEVEADNLAYVIYTSGSTGTPKGVGVSHRSLANLLADRHRRQPLSPSDAASCWTGFGFDVSVWEIFSPLTAGASLHLVPEALRADPPGFFEWLRAGRVSSAYVPAFMLPELARSLAARPLGLRWLLVGVEPIEESLLASIAEASPGLRVLNGYGPTEATVYVTGYEAGLLKGVARRTPVGRPISNTRVYVLDAGGRPVPVGVPGEIHVGGVPLARGYVNRPARTAERFVPDPFSGEAGARLYRTGDMGRWLTDGNLMFVGRADGQVKVRGHRVELGEVEAALGECAGVGGCVVVAGGEDAPGGAPTRLVAYVVPVDAAAPPAAPRLREQLRAKLPDYMVPSAFVMLDALPLTPNGKPDRRALPEPGRVAADAESEPPREGLEEVVAGVFSAVLKADRIGRTDNFFELGGHSLLATQAVSRLREACGAEVPLRALFEQPTVEGLSRVVGELLRGEAGATAAVPPLVRVSREQELPLSFAQQRLWFLDQLEPASSFYNIPSAVRLGGPLDTEALGRAFSEVARRHESLRTSFPSVEGKPVQLIHPPRPLDVAVEDLTALPEAGRGEEARRLAAGEAALPFDLSAGPLVRVRLLRLAEEEHVLLLTMHHVVSDGWSMTVLVGELTTLYAAYARGEESPLEELPIQYADYSVWQREWLRGEVLERELSYWRAQLGGAPTLELPTDRP